MYKTQNIKNNYGRFITGKTSAKMIARKFRCSENHVNKVWCHHEEQMKIESTENNTGGIISIGAASINEVLSSLEQSVIVEVIPKVEELPNGKIQLTYQSIMNL